MAMAGQGLDADAANDWIARERASEVRSLREIAGGIGRRRYWRAELADGSRAILMLSLAESAEILPPALRGTDPPRVFAQMTRMLSEHGLPVPEIFAEHPGEPWLLLEDLGERRLLDLSPDERGAYLAEAIDLAACAHAIPTAQLPFSRVFDAEWIEFELQRFCSLCADASLRGELRTALARLGAAIAALPKVVCLRDLQSTNLMIDSRGKIRVIDYQDALLAPRELDLTSLLHDSYLDISATEREALLGRYAGDRDPAAFALLTVQRKSKDFALFHALSRAGHEASYGAAASRARASVCTALCDLPTELAPVAEILARVFESFD
jgi:aminoglycoside/choline kinase family phosphotransferase